MIASLLAVAPAARSPAGDPLLEVQGLAKTYADGTQALQGVDLDLAPGVFGLLGPNGAGKTTLLSILALSQEPTSGTLRYAGLDPRRRRDRPAIRGLLGCLPQEYHPLGSLTGEEYLIHCARLRRPELTGRQLRERAQAWLEAVDLARVGRRWTRTYSGGMKRRLGFAQALVHEPRIVIVDEPTAGLDPEERIRLRTLIASVAADVLVLLSTHIVEDVESICPRLGIISGGLLRYCGDPAELMRQVDGQLWLVPDSVPPAAAVVILGRRALRSGESAALVRARQRPAGALPFEPTLEAAYAAFLGPACV
jgi:ABC-2 type transport system ATP-binding protein